MTSEVFFEMLERGNMSSVGDNIKIKNTQWSFGGDVHLNFDEHVRKSVPLYNEGHNLILQISDFFQRSNAVFYDIGCSTGSLIFEMAQRHKGSQIRLVGCDTELGMVESARQRCAGLGSVEIVCGDVLDMEMEEADLVTSYYTLQFVHPSIRQQVVDKIYQGLNWGGAFLIFEKVRGSDARFQDILTQTYHEFKRGQGYSDAEIGEKSRSLKGVLEPFSSQGNIEMFERAGFKDIMTIFKYTCFEGFLAIK